jgi:hypothetical protein
MVLGIKLPLTRQVIYHLNYVPCPYVYVLFLRQSFNNFAQTGDPPTSTSRVAGITSGLYIALQLTVT